MEHIPKSETSEEFLLKIALDGLAIFFAKMLNLFIQDQIPANKSALAVT